MKHLSTSTTNRFIGYARRGALLLALGAAGPAAWGQSFAFSAFYSVGTGPYGIAAGDVNGDGRQDVATANYNSNSVSVLLGQPSGGFGPKTDYPTATGPRGIALGDVNGDGRPDIVTTDALANVVSVLLNLNNGRFGLKTDYTTGAGPVCVALGDTNGDGHLDIVTANGSASSTSVLLGQANGGFGAKTDYLTGAGPNGLALGDVNGDGRPDIVTSNYNLPPTGGYKASVLLSLPNGGFAAKTDYQSGGAAPSSLVLADVDRNGLLDILTANSLANNVSVLLGIIGGGFSQPTTFPVGNFPKGIAVKDVNGDGFPDVITTNSFSGNVSVLLGVGAGYFGFHTDYFAGAGPDGLAVVDVNGDGRPDIITANHDDTNVTVLLNTGTYTPLAARPTAAPDVALAPNPAHDAFAVTLPAGTTATQAELVNALGQVVRRPAGAGPSFVVETGGLAPGIYTLRLGTGAAIVTRRVAVQ
ncbi:T9SS type A sorting domain-containing protein [Hymenobacter convexus]|uniref:T9SS type A sorting domain-containing protein n=1 Tax=Hymenobacter sp. CA1UV-4 TaxID=3063782 RepID=UPI002712A7B0|nr:T9SS type A sorting domain-containing protein [Hymenobacter sp. CA1UV-4]MDO7850968.1 T9SS type A sorting domain-containing protein [Hymenobacter sp. CA1UV-4]